MYKSHDYKAFTQLPHYMKTVLNSAPITGTYSARHQNKLNRVLSKEKMAHFNGTGKEQMAHFANATQC